MKFHLNKKNKPTMINVSNKKITSRYAIAQGIIKFNKKTFLKILSNKTAKGEIINTAIIGGILAAKKTDDLIPLCHNIPIDSINIDINTSKSKNSLIITCEVKNTAKTGVEMEALTGVSIACLTIYDMCKGLDKKITINEIKLIKKTGGKSNFTA